MHEFSYIGWNTKDTAQTVTARFAAVANHIPGNIALIDQQRPYTFHEIDSLSDRIASQIQAADIPQKSPVAVLFGPSVFRIAGLIGILKTGRPFVPLDVTYPAERNKLIFNDSGSTALCTDNFCKNFVSEITDSERQIFNLDHLPERENRIFQPIEISPDDICTIIFTSGTTGRPKGVLHTHQSVLFDAMVTSLTLGIRISDRFIQVSPTGSVASLSQTTSSVLSGAVSVPFSLRHHGLQELGKWIQQQNITIFSSAPTIFRHLCMEFPTENVFKSIRIVRSGGEQVFESDLDLCLKHCNNSTIFQIAYGSTETGIISTKNYQPVKYLKSASGKMPIGKVAQGKKILILNENMVAVSKGETGELFVGSAGLAQGYLGPTSLTSEKFLTIKSEEGKDDRFYKTGDLVRQLPNDDLEFAGRADAQMKINGFRIEPGEIEAAMLTYPKISECYVKICPIDNQDFLTAYIKIDQNHKIDENDLRDFLLKKLPFHMVPALYVFLDKFPRVPNGKIDRQALPEPKKKTSFISAKDFSLRKNTLILIKIWKDILKTEDVGPETNFFEAGGDSLRMMKMIGKIEKQLNLKIEIATIVKNPTIAKLTLILGIEQQCSNVEVIKLGAGNNETPIVVIGPGAFVYHLAKEMKHSRPVYAFPLPNYVEVIAWEGDLAKVTLDKLARIYTNLILQHIATDQFILAGHSFHGIIAFQVAHQLLKAGKNIENIVMFDTKLKLLYPKLLTRMAYFSLHLKPDLAIKALILRFKNHFQSSKSQKNEDQKIRLDLGIEEINQVFSILTKTKEVMAFEEYSKFARTVRREAFKNHIMTPLDCKGVLMRVKIKETEIINHIFPDYGWQKYFKAGLKIIETDGDHMGMIRQPNLQDLAKKLNTLL